VENLSQKVVNQEKCGSCSTRISGRERRRWPGAEASLQFIVQAEVTAPFKFEMIQTDHGSEFSLWFTHGLWHHGVKHRHSRVRQSNDNAHLERFNRTVQEECLDKISKTVTDLNHALTKYIPYYNEKRLHFGLKLQTPLQVLTA
jgi:transposase InsO family protein